MSRKKHAHLVALAWLASACFDLDLEGKTACETSADCLHGLACVKSVCGGEAFDPMDGGGDADAASDPTAGGGGGGFGGMSGSGGVGGSTDGGDAIDGSSGSGGGAGTTLCTNDEHDFGEDGVDCGFLSCGKPCFARIACDDEACTTSDCFDGYCVSEVGGSFDHDLVLPALDVPYRVIEDISVRGSLTIEPGAIVLGGGHSIEAFHLDVVGTPERRIVLEGLRMQGGDPAYERNTIIHFGFVDGFGTQPTPSDTRPYAGFAMNDSRFRDTVIAVHAGISTRIERNVFVDLTGLSIAEQPLGAQYLTNNYFEAVPTIHVGTSLGGFATVRHNTFADAGGHAFSGGSGLFATNNYWGTTNTAVIESMIRDSRDDEDAPGEIAYVPYLTEPHADTPKRDTIPSGVSDGGVDDGGTP